MKKIMCSLYDAKAESFSLPFFADTKNLAVRIFGDACLKEGTVINQHPEDFFCYQVGEFDELSGEVIPVKPVSLSSAMDFVKRS